MPLHVGIAEVQSWLDPGKLLLPNNDPLPEEFNQATIVLARLSQVYNTATWVDAATTPMLVRVIIAIRIAANRYNKSYSEESDAGNKYANKLERMAENLLQDLANGILQLTDAESTNPSANNPIFYPDDLTGASQIVDAQGFIIGWEGSEDIKFTMADRY
jgi:hypothetical protein